MLDINFSVNDDHQWSRELAFSAEDSLKKAQKMSFITPNYLLKEAEVCAILSVAAAIRSLKDS